MESRHVRIVWVERKNVTFAMEADLWNAIILPHTMAATPLWENGKMNPVRDVVDRGTMTVLSAEETGNISTAFALAS